MENLIEIRKISQNRRAFHQMKQNTNKELNIGVQSTLRGPALNRRQILDTCLHLSQKIKFQNKIDQMVPTAFPTRPVLNLVVVTCLYRRPLLWRIVLAIMASYPIKKIVAVWSEEDDKAEIGCFLEEMPPYIVDRIHFVHHPGLPLNHKWQFGILEAHKFDPEAVLTLEPNFLITWNYLREAYSKIQDGYELVGSRNWLSIFIQDAEQWQSGVPDYVRLCQYNERRLDGEFVGSGRMLSSHFLRTMKWQLYTSRHPMNDSLDKLSYYNIKRHRPKMIEVPLHANHGRAVIHLAERSSEKQSVLFKKYYDRNIPGSTWLADMIEKSRYIDYTINQDIYLASLRVFYQNFWDYILDLRSSVNNN